MALRDQPYIPLYVQDFMTDEKLLECSAESVGVYIMMLCVLHKSDEYGTILLKQKDKQHNKQSLNFAMKLARHLPFGLDVIQRSINELCAEKVIQIEGDKLFQKRMIKDNQLSITRANAGKKGGQTTTKNNKKFAQAKPKANTEYEIESVNEDEIKNSSLEKSEKPFLKLTLVDWQRSEKFQEVYLAFIDMVFKNHQIDWREEQHFATMRELKDYTEAESIKAVLKAIQGNYKTIYPQKENGKGKPDSKNLAAIAAANRPDWKDL